MAAATCTKDGLATAGACFTQPNFGSKRQKALIAYLWWKIADSVTSTTLTFDQLVTSASCIADGLTADQKVAGLIGILNRGFDASVIEFVTTINVLTKDTATEAIKCIENLTEAQLDAVILYSTCRFFGIAT